VRVGIGNFVAKIIGPAAVGVDIVKMLVQRFGDSPRYNIEIFVVMRGQPARVFCASSASSRARAHAG